MFKIGEFSKLSHITVKALRFYEKERLLIPVYVDKWTGYRFYETTQLETAAKVLSIYHKGSYATIGEAYAFIVEYAEKNNYEIAGLIRESYIDGIWNKESVCDWLTEVQLPIK